MYLFGFYFVVLIYGLNQGQGGAPKEHIGDQVVTPVWDQYGKPINWHDGWHIWWSTTLQRTYTTYWKIPWVHFCGGLSALGVVFESTELSELWPIWGAMVQAHWNQCLDHKSETYDILYMFWSAFPKTTIHNIHVWSHMVGGTWVPSSLSQHYLVGFQNKEYHVLVLDVLQFEVF